METLTGHRPIAFRSPYLMAPTFFDIRIYSVLEEHGYRYVSNREVRYQQELFHPRRLRIRCTLNKDNIFTKLLDVAINWNLIIHDNIYGHYGVARYISNLQWLVSGCSPFMRGNIIEVPMYSPLDCDLVGLPMTKDCSEHEIVSVSYTHLTLQ